MKEYIEREAFIESQQHLYCENCARRKNGKGKFVYDIGDAPCSACGIMDVLDAVADFPAADVVEVRQIRAFIDKLIAERDKYDLHSMRWKHYDCDRLLIEQMLDEMDGGVNDG